MEHREPAGFTASYHVRPTLAVGSVRRGQLSLSRPQLGPRLAAGQRPENGFDPTSCSAALGLVTPFLRISHAG